MPATRAVLLAAVIVALALLASVAMLPRERYTLTQLSDGVALRLDANGAYITPPEPQPECPAPSGSAAPSEPVAPSLADPSTTTTRGSEIPSADSAIPKSNRAA